MSGNEIVIGVSGGIAAYKTAGLVSTLVQSGRSVSVVMTQSATHFIGPATFAALSGRPVALNSFSPTEFPYGAHIELANRADVLCVAPATADFLAKMANGIADDLLSTLYLCFTGPVVVAPAMNCEMWAKPSVQRNVEQIAADGVHLVGPEEGWLSCRRKGWGRMTTEEKIIAQIDQVLNSS